jgi:single-strand DNA-binding protein
VADLRVPDTNIVIIAGRLGQTPDLRYTQSNRAYCRLSVAISEHWRDKNGDKKEKTTWVSVTVWDKQAEYCGENLHKGMAVQVEGKLDAFEKEDGTKVLQVQARRVLPLEWREQKQESAPRQQEKQRKEREQYEMPQDEDIPF